MRVGYDATTGTVGGLDLHRPHRAGLRRPVPGHVPGRQGIDETLTDGNKFGVSPRVGFAYDITGEQKLVARGAFGIFYDRPQGNQVFDLITNPPGTAGPDAAVGPGEGRRPRRPALYAPVGLNAERLRVEDCRPSTSGTSASSMQLPADFVLDVSYVGSESRDLLQKRQINALPYGTAYLASSQDPTRGQTCTGCSALSTLPGGNALPTDLLRPATRATRAIRMWEFSAYSNYKALQTTISRRLHQGADVQRQLHPEFREGHRRRRLGRRPHRRQGHGGQLRSAGVRTGRTSSW